MAETRTEAEQTVAEGDANDRRHWLAAGGLVGALLASSCCIAPLVLAMLGISGAWIANLTALEPYKPYFAGGALVFIALGFRQHYIRRPDTCADDTLCARPGSAAVTKSALWLATVLVAVSLTISWWAPLLY